MKKFLAVFFAAVLVLGLLSMVSCSKSSTTSPSPTATVGPLYSQSFDSSVGNWAIDTGVSSNAISTSALSTTEVTQGTHSVALTLQMAGAAQAAFVDKSIGGAANWAGKTITMKVWIPAAILASSTPYALEITIQGTSSWTTDNSWVTSGLTANAWNTLTYVVPNDAVGAAVQSIGFNIQEAGGTDMTSPATLYIDDVEVN